MYEKKKSSLLCMRIVIFGAEDISKKAPEEVDDKETMNFKSCEGLRDEGVST